ncbi:MAG: PDZ domain-containing protein [Candidatus Omnitrophota bacterium]
MKLVLSFRKSRPWKFCGLLFLCLLCSGFSLSSSKSEGRSFPLPGNFEEVWNATLATLEAEKIPLGTVDKARGYIQSATFPLYKKEYKEWAKAPSFSSSGFCALEIGVVEKDPAMTVVGIRAFFKRKTGLSSKGFRKRDGSRGRFEGFLGKNIHERLVEKKFPALKSVILGCDLHYDDKTAHYFIAGADASTLAYEQGLRNGDVLLKIAGEEVTPGNLFGFFLNIPGESLKKFTVLRQEGELELPIRIFFLNPDAPHFGFRVERDPKALQFVVMSVRAASPADKEGFLPGDILLKQNDVLLDTWEHYYRAILAQKDGEAQAFQVERGGKLLEKRILPVSHPTPA